MHHYAMTRQLVHGILLCHLQDDSRARVPSTLGCAKLAAACGSVQQHLLACAAVRQQHAELRRQLEAGALATPSSAAGSPGACSEAAARTLPPQVRVTSDCYSIWWLHVQWTSAWKGFFAPCLYILQGSRMQFALSQ